jgi:glycosyltransferase involved in cell wall biosynthesis
LALYRAKRLLEGYLREHPVDLIHTHYRKSTFVARQLVKRHRVPVLFTLHMPTIPMRGLWRWMTDFGDHTHVGSVETRDWFFSVTGLPQDRVTVINMGVDVSRFPVADRAEQAQARARWGLPSGVPVAAFVGRLEDPKNEDWLIDVALAASERLPDLRVLISGRGPREEALRQGIAKHGLSHRVQMIGYVDPWPVYAASDALLIPSRVEGCCMVAAEAMSVGRPVLRTRTGGVSRQIIEGVTGRSVPVDRSVFISAAIGFLADREKLWEMGQAAARHARASLSFEDQYRSTLELYYQMLGKR